MLYCLVIVACTHTDSTVSASDCDERRISNPPETHEDDHHKTGERVRDRERKRIRAKEGDIER